MAAAASARRASSPSFSIHEKTAGASLSSHGETTALIPASRDAPGGNTATQAAAAGGLLAAQCWRTCTTATFELAAGDGGFRQQTGRAFRISVGQDQRDLATGGGDFLFRSKGVGPFQRLIDVFLSQGHRKMLDQADFFLTFRGQLLEGLAGEIGVEFEGIPGDPGDGLLALFRIPDFPCLVECGAPLGPQIGTIGARRAIRPASFWVPGSACPNRKLRHPRACRRRSAAPPGCMPAGNDGFRDALSQG